MGLNLLIKLGLLTLSLFIAYKNKDISEIQDIKTNNYTKAMLLIWLIPTLALLGYTTLITKDWDTLFNFVILLPMAVELLIIDIRDNEGEYDQLNFVFPFMALFAKLSDMKPYSTMTIISFALIYLLVVLITRTKMFSKLLGYGNHASLSTLLISYSIIFMKIGMFPQNTDYQFPIKLVLICIATTFAVMIVQMVQRMHIRHKWPDMHRTRFISRTVPMSLAMFISAVGLFIYNTGIFL